MDKFEFQLNYYFNMYKDLPIRSRNEFRMSFRKKHGKFQYLEELIVMIERYQFKKYGETLSKNYIDHKTKEQRHKEAISEYYRKKKRLGR